MSLGYRLGMRGGHRAARIAVVVALLALPLTGLAALFGGTSPAVPAATRSAVLRVAPGQASDAVAVRPGTDADPAARAGAVRGLSLLAILAAAAAALGLLPTGTRPELRPVPVRFARSGPATGRGPPLRSSS